LTVRRPFVTAAFLLSNWTREKIVVKTMSSASPRFVVTRKKAAGGGSAPSFFRDQAGGGADG
jgi:hypothetical protein